MTAPEPISERTARVLVARRSGDMCEAGYDAPATEVHHRMNRSQGGTWNPANLLHLCSAHHRWITTSPRGAALKGWALPRGSDPAIEPAFMARWGFVLLTSQGGLIESATTTETTRRTA